MTKRFLKNDFTVEQLEPRLLFSADAGLLPIDAFLPHDEGMVDYSTVESALVPGTGSTHLQGDAEHQRHEVVFVDTGVSDYQKLVDDLLAQNGSGRYFEVILLDSSRDGIDQINDSLSRYQDIDAMHIISHGTDGAVQLGSTTLSLDTLDAYTDSIEGWKNAFTDEADLLFYGCDLAAGEEGRGLINSLSFLTGADIAASNDLTGAKTLGGDWELEVKTGHIETVEIQASQVWNGVLDLVSLDAAADTYIDTGNQSNNYGDSATLIVDQSGGGIGDIRILLQFDLSSIPAGSTITDAKIKMNAELNTGAFDINIYEITEAWDEGSETGNAGVANWDERQPGTGWTTAGGTYDPTIVDTLNTSAGGNHTWDITSLVQEWYTGTKVNNGIIIGSPDGGGNSVTYYSRETANPPHLEVTYTPPPDISVNSTTAGQQENTDVATDAAGNFVVVWESEGQDGDAANETNIYARMYDSTGTALTGEFLVNETIALSQSDPQIAMDDAGNFVITWATEGQDGDAPSETNIYARLYNSAGTAITGEFLVNQTTVNSQITPSVAMDGATGEFMIAWAGFNGSDWNIHARRYDVSGGVLDNEITVNSTIAGDQVDPDVDVDSAAEFGVVWTSYGQDGDLATEGNIYVQNYRTGGPTRAGEILANTTTAGHQHSAALAKEDDGDYTVVWVSKGQDGDGSGIFADNISFGSGNNKMGEIQVNLTSAGEQSSPDVAVEPLGNIVFTWESTGQDGDGPLETNVYARIYEVTNASIAPFGNEILVNTTTSGDQESPAIAADGDDDFVIAWSGEGAGDSEGVFARVFEDMLTNAAPKISLAKPSISYTENDPPLAIDAGLSVSDPDDINLAGATVSILDGFTTGQDWLRFTDQLGIAGIYNSTTGVLTLTGPASVADYQTALRTVKYENTSDDPNTTQRLIRVTVDDGVASTSGNRKLSITAFNDEPLGGFVADDIIPQAQISQAADGSGIITITWKGRDAEADNVTLKNFQYSDDGGASWYTPNNGDSSGALSVNWTDNGGSGWSTAATLGAATAHQFTFNTQHADVTAVQSLDNIDQSDIQIRFVLNDGSDDSVNPATTENFRVDNETPTVTVNLLNTNDTTPQLTGTVNDTAATIQVTVNSNTYAATNNGDGTWTLADNTIAPALADGIWEVAVTATDGAGNAGSDATANELTVDSTAPTVTVNLLTTNDTTPQLTGTVNDTAATIQVTVNGSTYAATNNGDGTWTLADNTIAPALADGIWEVAVTATDGVGNAGSDATANELTVDTTAPTVTVNLLTTNDSTPQLTGTVNDTAATIQVTVNGSTYAATNNGDGTWTLADNTIAPALADGIWEVAVTATDGVGNAGSDATANELTVDTTAPTVTVNLLTTNDSTPQLTGTVNDTAATIQVTVNGSTYAAANNGDGTWTLADNTIAPALADGIWEVAVTATDGVGNAGSDATANELTVDTTAPTVTVNLLTTNDSTPQLTGTVNDTAATIQVTVNGNTYAATNNGDGTWTLADNTIAPALADGVWEVAVTATDGVGNAGSDATANELTVDTAAPTVTVNLLNTNDSTPQLTGTVNDTAATIQVTVNGNTYAATNNGDGTWTLADNTIAPALADGLWEVAVTATDGVGNAGSDATANELTVDTTAPTVTVNLLTTNDSTPQLTGAVNDTAATIQVTVNGNTYAATNNGDGTWTLADNTIAPALAEGLWEVAVTATDGVGNAGSDATANELTVDINFAPTATNLNASETYALDTPLNLTDIVVSDADTGETVTVTLTMSHPAAGILSTATSGTVTSNYDAAGGVWKVSGAIADVNALLAGVTYTPSAGYVSNFTIAVTVTDGTASVSGVKKMIGPVIADTKPDIVPDDTPEPEEEAPVEEEETEVEEETLPVIREDTTVKNNPLQTEQQNAGPAAGAGGLIGRAGSMINMDLQSIMDSSSDKGTIKNNPMEGAIVEEQGFQPVLSFRQISNSVYIRLRNSLDAIKREAETEHQFEQTVIGSAIATTTGLSVGYVVWMLRGGMLLSSVLTSMPAWQIADPLPLLGKIKDDDDSDEDESLESILKKGAERDDKTKGNPDSSGEGKED